MVDLMVNKQQSGAAGKGVPAGFKLTELGVIPKDWYVARLGDVCDLINGRGFKPYEWGFEGLPIIRIQNLNGSDEFNYYNGNYDSKIFIKQGQLLFAWSGSRGTSFGPHIWSGNDALLNYHTWKLLIKTPSLEEGYFYYILKNLTSKIEEMAHGASALVHTQKGEMEQFLIPLPLNKDEQIKIYKSLSSIDALVIKLEKLLIKKHSIKTATMQQLLTGKTRLPQFALRKDGTVKGYRRSEFGDIPEDWETSTLDNFISKLDAGVSVNSVNEKDIFSHGKNILKTSCVSNGYFYGHEAKSIVPDDINRAKTTPKKGCIIISRMNTPNLVGELGYVERDEPNLYLPDRLWQMNVCQEQIIDNRWLAYILSFPLISNKLKETATGTSNSMKNISKDCLYSLSFPRPSKDEQTAIAAILSDMDKDIQTLQQRLDKTRQLKQGMMQELLTGKTRLI